MPTLRERIARFALRDQYDFLTTQAEAFRAAYEKSPHMMSRMGLLSEMDTRSISYLQQHLGYQQIAAWGDKEPTEQDRRREVENARWFYQWDPVTGQAITLWTDFGFGQVITITPDDSAAQDDWAEFWTATRNRPMLGARKIHLLSDTLLTDGELFLVFFTARTGGETTLRRIDSLEITKVVTDPDDKFRSLYYQRDFQTGEQHTPTTVYYPDWQATPDQLSRAKLPTGATKAEEQRPGTGVVVLHVAINERDGRGWPITTRGAPWSKAYWDFLQDRAAVSRKVAMYVDKLNVKGGSRAIDVVKNALQSSLVNNESSWETNPIPAAGSDWLENEAIKRERLPMGSGAGDARIDGMTIVSQAGIGMGITSPAYLGRPDAMQNRAVAQELALPMIRRWNRYQLLWGSVWRDVAEIVLGAKSRKTEVDVSTDASIEIELDILSKAVIDAKAAGLIPEREATLILLKRPEFGIDNADEIVAQMYPETEAAQEPTVDTDLAEVRAQLTELIAEMRDDSTTTTAEVAVEVIDDYGG